MRATYRCLQVERNLTGRVWNKHLTSRNNDNLKHVLPMECSFVNFLHNLEPLDWIAFNILEYACEVLFSLHALCSIYTRAHMYTPKTQRKTHSSFLLILWVSQCNVAQFKVSLSILYTGHSCCGTAPLPQPSFAQDQVVNVAAILGTSLYCHWKEREGGRGGENLLNCCEHHNAQSQ